MFNIRKLSHTGVIRFSFLTQPNSTRLEQALTSFTKPSSFNKLPGFTELTRFTWPTSFKTITSRCPSCDACAWYLVQGVWRFVFNACQALVVWLPSSMANSGCESHHCTVSAASYKHWLPSCPHCSVCTAQYYNTPRGFWHQRRKAVH